MCLDDYGWGSTNNTIADLWDCTGSLSKDGLCTIRESGYLVFKTNTQDSVWTTPEAAQMLGTLTTLWGCVNTATRSGVSWIWATDNISYKPLFLLRSDVG